MSKREGCSSGLELLKATKAEIFGVWTLCVNAETWAVWLKLLGTKLKICRIWCSLVHNLTFWLGLPKVQSTNTIS